MERVPSNTAGVGRSELESPITGTDHCIFGTFSFKFLCPRFTVKKKKEENLFSLNSMAIKSAKGRSLHLPQ